jgi:hypothetical protein
MISEIFHAVMLWGFSTRPFLLRFKVIHSDDGQSIGEKKASYTKDLKISVNQLEITQVRDGR